MVRFKIRIDRKKRSRTAAPVKTPEILRVTDCAHLSAWLALRDDEHYVHIYPAALAKNYQKDFAATASSTTEQ